MIRQLRRDALESDAATHDVVPEVAVADGVGGAVSGNALKAGKDAAIKADLGRTAMPPAAGDKTDPGDGASFKPRCPLPPDLIEINGTVSVCTPSDAEGVLRRWAEIARSARRRLSAALPQKGVDERAGEHPAGAPRAERGARRGRAHRQRGSAARAPREGGGVGLRRARAEVEGQDVRRPPALARRAARARLPHRRRQRGAQPDSSPGRCTDAVSPPRRLPAQT